MEGAGRVGRVIGVFILLQMVGGGVVNFALEKPLFEAPGFLVSAGSHSSQIGLGVILGLLADALWVGMAVTGYEVFLQRGRRLALWLLALAVASLAVAVLENVAVLSMVSVSEAYLKAGSLERERLETLRVVVASARNWPHFIGRILDGCMIIVFYTLLYRLAVIPKALYGFGLLAALLMITSLGMPLFGHDVVFPMLAPVGLAQLTVAIWLVTKGFPDQPAHTIEARGL